MKIFWWQGGLHAEPETPEEGKAMRALYDAARRTSIATKGGGSGPKKSMQTTSKSGSARFTSLRQPVTS